MAAEANLITSADINSTIREVEFVSMFNETTKKLMEALGITRKIPKQAGTVLKAYTVSGTLASGTVAEGDVIPLSKYKSDPVAIEEIKLAKYRKSTSAEAIVEDGFAAAVDETTERMLKDIQKDVRQRFFTFLGTGTGTASGANLQALCANMWAELAEKFEDDSVSTVFFVNPKDIAGYLGTANVTTQTAFGMTYLNDFLGMGRVIINASVPQGTVYATAQDNIVLYYIPVNGADLSEAFSFTADETGLIGIHEQPDYSRMTCDDTIVSGLTLFADYLDGVVVGTLASGASVQRVKAN